MRNAVVMEIVNRLVCSNLLCCESNGSVTCHSRLVRNYMEEYLKKIGLS